MIEEITQTLWLVAQKRRKCRILIKGEPLPRVIHPYGICLTTRNRIALICWQELGFTKAGAQAGYRNLKLADCAEVEMLETHFQKRNDFNPIDAQYKEWVFHI